MQVRLSTASRAVSARQSSRSSHATPHPHESQHKTAPVAAVRAPRSLLPRRAAVRAHAAAADLSAMNGGKGPLVVIDNYDSFTYNLCQVSRKKSA